MLDQKYLTVFSVSLKVSYALFEFGAQHFFSELLA